MLDISCLKKDNSSLYPLILDLRALENSGFFYSLKGLGNRSHKPGT